VRHRVDERLLEEIRGHALRFTCGDCVYFLPGDHAEESCAHFWPNEEHRRVPDEVDVGKEVVFCKEFDLR
jgi:hypothetical protein